MAIKNEENSGLENKKPAAAKKAVKTKKNRQRKKISLSRWFRETKSELKKVVWPTPKQVLNSTIVALVVMLASAIVLWAFDTLASKGVEVLIALVS